MKVWKRNAIIAAALVLVLGGIYLNWKLSGTQKTPFLETLNTEKVMDDALLVMAPEQGALEAAASADLYNPKSVVDSFAQMRLSRQESRDSALELLQETIAYAGADEDVSLSSQQLNQIVKLALSEAQIESMVVSKGFSDCVAYMTEDGISLAVPSGEAGLTDADVALLTDIITSQSDYTLPQIKIIGVN